MFFRFLSLADYFQIVSAALEKASLDESSINSPLLLGNVLVFMREDMEIRQASYLASLNSASTQVDESSLPFYPHPTPSDALPSLPSSSEGSSTEDYSILIYFLCSSFVIGSCTLLYVVINHFFVPLPPMEGILDPSLLSSLSSASHIPSPQVSIPESSINDYLPSLVTTTTVIITIVVVATL
jgi:hypothetical protein